MLLASFPRAWVQSKGQLHAERLRAPLHSSGRALGGLSVSTGLRRGRELRREGMPRLQRQL